MPSTEVDSLAVAPIVKLCFRCQCRRRTLTGKKSVDIWPALIVYTVQHNTTWLPSVNIIAQECYVVPSTEVDSLAVAPIINWQVILQQQQQTIGQNGNDKLIHKRSNRLESCTYHIKTASLQSLGTKNSWEVLVQFGDCFLFQGRVSRISPGKILNRTTKCTPTPSQTQTASAYLLSLASRHLHVMSIAVYVNRASIISYETEAELLCWWKGSIISWATRAGMAGP